MGKRATRVKGKGEQQYPRDAKAIHGEIRSAKRQLGRNLTPSDRRDVMARLEGADAQLRKLNRSRFEKLANERLSTLMRASDDLIKLTGQPRYAQILTQEHCNVIIDSIQTRFAAVQGALQATIAAQAAKQTVGLFLGVSLFAAPAE